MTREEYLGDGVYAKWDGFGIQLDLRRQDKSRIYLEPIVLEKLNQFYNLVSRLDASKFLCLCPICNKECDCVNSPDNGELLVADHIHKNGHGKCFGSGSILGVYQKK